MNGSRRELYLFAAALAVGFLILAIALALGTTPADIEQRPEIHDGN
jgi:hypothetical protein